jgi:hypothetical protein
MRVYSIKIFLILLILSGVTNGQTDRYSKSKPEEVSIESWKKGSDFIKNQQIKLKLSSKNKDYEQKFVSESGKTYLLRLIHSPYFDLALEHWEVEMYEVLSNGENPKLSENLLSTEKYGSLRQDAYIGVLYLEEKPIVVSLDDEVLWGEGKGFYYFKTTRKINIESFCLVRLTNQN